MARVKRIKARALAVLSRKKSLYSTRRLIEAARARGFRARAIDVLKCNLVLESGKPRIFYRGKELRGLSVAVPRIGASVTVAGWPSPAAATSWRRCSSSRRRACGFRARSWPAAAAT
jgi:hypothetical protein